jgi:hypothetical protein
MTGGRAIHFEDWEQEFRNLDILVSSTAAPHAIITLDKLAPFLRARRHRPLFMIDLAIPRDIDPAVRNFDSVYRNGGSHSATFCCQQWQLINEQTGGQARLDAEGGRINCGMDKRPWLQGKRTWPGQSSRRNAFSDDKYSLNIESILNCPFEGLALKSQ